MATLNPPTPPRSHGPREWRVASACILHALVFGVAAVFLPIKFGAGALILGTLALAHLGVAVLAGLGHPTRERAFLYLSRLSLIAFLAVCGFVLHAALFVSQLYGGLGRGIAALMVGVLCVFALWTVPLGLWGLSRSGKGLLRSRVIKGGGAAVLACGLLGMAQGEPQRLAQGIAAPSAQVLQTQLQSFLSTHAPAGRAAGIRDPGPWPCANVTHTNGALVVAYAWHDQKAQARCFDVADGAQLVAALRQAKLAGLYRLDWVTHAGPWHYARAPWLVPLSLRPGLDGVCMQGRCLASWQLVALDAYLSLRPVASIPDLRFGVSPQAVQTWLGAKSGDPAIAITTQSYIITPDARVVALQRQRRAPLEVPPSLSTLDSVKTQAQRYLLSAQFPDGRFEYLRQVYMEQPLPEQLNLPRQGGTLAALCEWGEESSPVHNAVQKTLDSLLRHQHRIQDWGVLWPKNWGDKAALGYTALPLIALLKCRARAGRRLDPQIGELLRGLLRFQREDGGFFPELHLVPDATGQGEHERLYAAGQAVLALLSALREQKVHPIAGAPAASKLHAAVKRAMQHYGQSYWTHFFSDFFYIEENWHCLAAKESLGLVDDPAYGDFCLDYLKFKSRFTLTAGSRVDSAFEGGYGFGNIVVPQVTPSAGQAEALAAGIAVLRARGQDTHAHRKELREILNFLWRQQLNDVNCRGCVDPLRVQGAFTESMISPTIRIDYVQHVLSAFGSGLEELRKGSASS